MSELKACPFCGSGDVRVIEIPIHAWVTCDQCDCDGPTCEKPEQAIAAWNRRADDNRGDV